MVSVFIFLLLYWLGSSCSSAKNKSKSSPFDYFLTFYFTISYVFSNGYFSSIAEILSESLWKTISLVSYLLCWLSSYILFFFTVGSCTVLLLYFVNLVKNYEKSVEDYMNIFLSSSFLFQFYLYYLLYKLNLFWAKVSF